MKSVFIILLLLFTVKSSYANDFKTTVDLVCFANNYQLTLRFNSQGTKVYNLTKDSEASVSYYEGKNAVSSLLNIVPTDEAYAVYFLPSEKVMFQLDSKGAFIQLEASFEKEENAHIGNYKAELKIGAEVEKTSGKIVCFQYQ